ncbi:MAG TPA: SDR family NAD(P)-dependent oxidoreductase, partial [Saprospiraceae bacterium]|nr:SDR family NAD(P)-dependent oxidoreductase [Saprospiraceae bacterium]
LLHKLRKLDPVSLADFTKDNYHYFFSITGDLDSYAGYKKMAEYDDKDSLIEQKLKNLEANDENLNIKEDKIDNEPAFEQLQSSYMKQTEESDSINKTNTQESKYRETPQSASSEPDSDLLEKLKAYKNGLLKDEATPTEKVKTTVDVTKEESKEDIFRSQEEWDTIQKLDKEVTDHLKSILNDNLTESTKEENKLSDDDDVWDEEEKEEPKQINFEDSLIEAVRKDPDNIDTRLQLIKYLIQNPANFSRTADQLEQVLKRDKNNVEAIYLLASLSETVGEHTLSRTYFEKLIDIQPDFPDVYYKLGSLVAQHFPKEQEVAAEYYKKAFQHDTTNLTSLERRADILHKNLAKPKKAIKVYKKIIGIDPEHPTAYYHLAELSFELDDRLNALSYYNKAKELTTRTKLQNEVSNNSETRIDSEPNADSEMLYSEHVQIPDAPTKIVSSYACITGATSGIGKALANLLASKSYNLILTGRRADKLLELASELKFKYDVSVETLVFDIRDFTQSTKAIESLGDKLDKIDILVNNAGLAMGLDYVYEANVEHWETMIDTNLKGLLYMTRLVTPSMVKRQRGHIVNIGSTAGKEVYPKGNVYCATKFAVDALTKSFRQDLYQHNIRVSQVCPGHTENTEFAITRFEGDREKASIYNDFNPLKAENIADIIYFILTQPPNVNIQDVLVMSTQQAGSTMLNRTGRIFDQDND